MISFDQAQTNCQDLSSDSTASSLTFFKRLMNVGYKLVLSDLGRAVTEKTQTASTVASQQYYQLPQDFNFLKSLTVTVSSIPYVVQEEESQEMWDYVNQSTTQTSDIPQLFFIRPGFGFSGAEVGLYPIPASASNTIRMVYEATDKDLSVDVYNTGTVTVTNGSATVTGAGTTFTAAMVGRYFQTTNDQYWYRIAAYTSATVVTLENVFEGASGSLQAYSISEAFALPEDLQILPVYYALAHYYQIKKSEGDERKFWTLFRLGLEEGKKRYGTKSRSGIIRSKNWRTRFPVYPSYFSQSVT